jgi:hypothetical protein
MGCLLANLQLLHNYRRVSGSSRTIPIMLPRESETAGKIIGIVQELLETVRNFRKLSENYSANEIGVR